MVDVDFLKAVRERNYYTFKDVSLLSDVDKSEIDWNWLIDYIDTHPYYYPELNNSIEVKDRKLKDIKPEWIGWLLTGCEDRFSTPRWAKAALAELQKTFYKNNVTLQLFGGISNESKSGHIHKDPMDVLYVQGPGKVNWSMWTTESKKLYGVDPKECTNIYSELYTTGRACYVPRGVYHCVAPLTSRCGFSFGIEGDIDPSTYI
jgi:hypothetical protein